jgi:hypothetical protein
MWSTTMSCFFEKNFSLSLGGTSIPLDRLGPCQIVQSNVSPVADVGVVPAALGGYVNTWQLGQNMSSVSFLHL